MSIEKKQISKICEILLETVKERQLYAEKNYKITSLKEYCDDNSILLNDYLINYLIKKLNEFMERVDLYSKEDIIELLKLRYDDYQENKKEEYLYECKLIFANKIVGQLIKNNDYKLEVADIASSKVTRPLVPFIYDSFYDNFNNYSFLSSLKSEFPSADEIRIIVPFISNSGIKMIRQGLDALSDDQLNSITIKILTTTFDGTANMVDILSLKKFYEDYINLLRCLEIRIEKFDINNNINRRIHAKSYQFKRKGELGCAYLGSSNLTYLGVVQGKEWNVRISEKNNKKLFDGIINGFDSLWDHVIYYDMNDADAINDLIKIQKDIINNKEDRKMYQKDFFQKFNVSEKKLRNYQLQALKQLDNRRLDGKKKHLIIMATGTGKTFLCATDFKNYLFKNPNVNLLFIAHQKEIIEQAIIEFRRVLQNPNFGEIISGENNVESLKDKNNLFITIQTLHNKINTFDNKQFDYVVMDEAHHAEAGTFQSVINYLSETKQLIGLTATPEREDGIDVKKYFGDEYAYEYRLWNGIEDGYLSQFDYFFINDDTSDLSQVDITKNSEVYSKINKEERCKLLVETIEKYVGFHNKPKAVIFCINKDDAKYISNYINKYTDNLCSGYLTSDVEDFSRRKMIDDFKNSKLNFLCVVNMFNEGVDVPDISDLFLLRPTSSLTLYLQQFGRGLRPLPNKRLSVYDFVNNIDRDFKGNKQFNFLNGLLNISDSKIFDLNEKIIDLNIGNILPNGCTVTFEKKAYDKVIDNVKKALRDRKLWVKEIYDFVNKKGVDYDSYCEFLNIHNLNIYDFYSLESKSHFVYFDHNINFRGENLMKYISKSIFNRFIYLNSRVLILYFIDRLNKKFSLKSIELFDDLLSVSVFYNVTKKNEIYNLKNERKCDRIVQMVYCDELSSLRNELINLLTWKLHNDKYLIEDVYLLKKDKITSADLVNLIVTKSQTYALIGAASNDFWNTNQMACLINSGITNDIGLVVTEKATKNYGYVDRFHIDTQTLEMPFANNWREHDSRFKKIINEDNKYNILIFYASIEHANRHNATFVFLGFAKLVKYSKNEEGQLSGNLKIYNNSLK